MTLGTGAGKTSLMLAILQLAPYSGEIFIDDVALKEVNEQACGRFLTATANRSWLANRTEISKNHVFNLDQLILISVYCIHNQLMSTDNLLIYNGTPDFHC